ncbi:MAG: beta-N-acetylhexosaminidase [Alphaproteobacteria bacterium]|nr:beta-N-acetylhexosaminidase [Alphaproteobacteria bacterium]
MPRACILGLEGTAPSAGESAFFAEADPLGFILFQRNCAGTEQVRGLTARLREISGRADAPILIDQEGGRVARLKPPEWRAPPAAARFGVLYRSDPSAAIRAARLNAELIGCELFDLGITVDCAPVLDLPQPDADPIIGDRAFSCDVDAVTELGAAFRDGLHAAGVLSVIKHIPGHGRARVDSHLALPRVTVSRDALAATDFAPFAALAGGPMPQSWAMTAHVVYEAIDRDRPATLSPVVVGEIIRREIGFDGILMSDDLSMRALSGPIGTRARDAIASGCDLALHCNGDMAEMEEIARHAPALSNQMTERLSQSLGALPKPQGFDRAAAVRELATLLKGVEGAD